MNDHPANSIEGPSFTHRTTGLRAFDEACIGLPVGALTLLTGRHVIDVDLLIDALRRADPKTVVIEAEYEIVMKKHRTIVGALRDLHD